MTDRKLLTADHAAMCVKRAGKPYRPSNGTEGDFFEALWCRDCVHNEACPIFLATLCHDVDEPEYPKEWQYDTDGQPVCKGHKEVANA